MEILFKNKTKYTKKAYQKYIQFHQEKYGREYTFTTIVTILFLSFCLIINLKYSNYPTSFILLTALIIFCYYRFFYPIKKIQKELKTDKFENEKEFTFKFYEKYFIISDKKNYDKIKYWQLHKVFKTKDFFYLYINKDHAFIIDKNNFTIGNSTDFFKFLKQKTFFKILHYK